MAPIFKIATFLSLSLYAAAQGTQFITGACTNDAACASACCDFVTGKCAAPAVAAERSGCGFGNAQANNDALAKLRAANGQSPAAAPAPPAQSPPAAAAPPAKAPAAGNGNGGGVAASNGAGNGNGKQFITGPCSSDADCASACCGFKSSKCAGPVIAQERDGGCGAGNAQPNNNAAKALTGRSLGRRGPALM